MCITNREALNLVEIDNVGITHLNGTVWTLKKVRHVIGLKKSLNVMCQLDDISFTIVFFFENV